MILREIPNKKDVAALAHDNRSLVKVVHIYSKLLFLKCPDEDYHASLILHVGHDSSTWTSLGKETNVHHHPAKSTKALLFNEEEHWQYNQQPEANAEISNAKW